MLFFKHILLVLCKALPSVTKFIPMNGYTKISSIVLLFCAILFYYLLMSINSGVTIYGGLFYLSLLNIFIDILIFIILFNFLIAWPIIKLELSYSTKKLNFSNILLNILWSSLLFLLFLIFNTLFQFLEVEVLKNVADLQFTVPLISKIYSKKNY